MIANFGSFGRRSALALVALVGSASVVAFGNINAGSDPSDPTGQAALLGAAVADAVPGVPSTFYAPPPTSTPDAPGQLIEAAGDASDPSVFVQGSHYFLFTSHRAGGGNVPVQAGDSLSDFGPPRDALPVLPKWSVPGYTWAPDVHRFGDHYVMYFTSAFIGTDPGIECIGAALGSAPEGPYTPLPIPFVCQAAHRGSIDPRTFSDLDGTTYLLWKSDDNADVHGTEHTGIYIQRLGPTGLTLHGSPTLLFAPDEPWQGRIVEAPDLVVASGAYWLFYSGGWFNQPAYAIGVARCETALGPCTDLSETPLLSSNAQGQGPGEESLFTDANGVYLLYTPAHSDVPEVTPPREVAVARIGFAATGPYLGAFNAR